MGLGFRYLSLYYGQLYVGRGNGVLDDFSFLVGRRSVGYKQPLYNYSTSQR